MSRNFRRQDSDCPSGSLFYTCSKGPFSGCCTVDPCSTGICPDEEDDDDDDDDDDDSPKSTKSETTATLTTTSESTATSATFSTVTSISPTLSTSDPGETVPSPPKPTPPPPPPPPSPPEHSKAGVVASSVGSVLAGVLVLGVVLLWFFNRRSKKKTGRPLAICACFSRKRRDKPMNNTQTAFLGKPSDSQNENKALGNSYEHKQNPEDMPRELEGGYYPLATPSVSELDSPSNRSTLVGSPGMGGTSPSMVSSVNTSPGIPRKSILTTLNERPTNGDGTGNHWGRTELDGSMPSGPDRSHHVELPGSLQIESPQHPQENSGSVTQNSHGTTPGALAITTREGVTLESNLNLSGEQAQQPDTNRSHVMSFMDYPNGETKTNGIGS